MAAPKSSVGAVQEYCAVNKIPFPIYDIITDDELGFVCTVTVMDIEGIGNGRSKRDAKHSAANDILKRLKTDTQLDVLPNDFDSIDDFLAITPLPATDTVALLRDYCVQHEHPLPIFELVNQYGVPNAPRFTMLCQIASIKRFGTSDHKKEARQKAAWIMLHAIRETSVPIDKVMEVVSINTKIESVEEERFRIFKTYRELIDSGENTEKFGIRLDERHDTYKRFHADLKNAALNIIHTPYESIRTKAFEVLDALKLHPRIHKMNSEKGREMLFIELDVPALDTCFSGYEDNIYLEIVNYFRIMLI